MSRELRFPHRPQGDQTTYYGLTARNTVGVIGRQYGKSTMAMLRAVKHLMARPDGNHYWVSPIVPQARVQYLRFLSLYQPFVKKHNKSHMEAQLINGSWTHYKGSDNPSSLKSDTLTMATLDECGTMHHTVYSESVRPMLAVNQGGADLIGTPKGKNWFYLMAENAKRGGEWAYHHAPSNKSPFFSQAEFDSIRASTAETIFRQEYLAEFIEAGSEVFRGFRECIKGELEQPQQGRLYVIGADIAKHVDWTVITVWDVERRHMVGFERFNQIDWPLIESRILATSQKYNRAMIKLDATGVGDPVYDRLRRSGANITPVKITAPVKSHLIESLVMAIEKQEISFPHIPELVNELAIFSVSKSPSGHMKYEAPPGYHDDIVLSMALGITESPRLGVGQLSWM